MSQDKWADPYATRKTLIEAARFKRREDEFCEFYRPLWCDWALAVGKRYSLQPSDRDDLFQETWLAIRDGLPRFQFRPGSKFRAWMRTIMEYTAIDLLKRKREFTNLDPETLIGSDEFWDEFWTMEKCYLLTVPGLRSKLEDLDAIFSPDQWDMFERRYFKRQNLAEIAKAYGFLKAGSRAGNASSVSYRIQPILNAAKSLLKDDLAD